MIRILRMSRGPAVATILCLTALAQPALAAPKQEVINQFTVKAEEFAARDTGRIVTAEIGMLKAFLAEAQNLLAQEEEEDLALALDRVKAAAELVDAELARADVEDQSNKAQARAEAKESELAKLNEETKALQKEREALEAGGAH